jgi:hypothetical protein
MALPLSAGPVAESDGGDDTSNSRARRWIVEELCILRWRVYTLLPIAGPTPPAASGQWLVAASALPTPALRAPVVDRTEKVHLVRGTFLAAAGRRHAARTEWAVHCAQSVH